MNGVVGHLGAGKLHSPDPDADRQSGCHQPRTDYR